MPKAKRTNVPSKVADTVAGTKGESVVTESTTKLVNAGPVAPVAPADPGRPSTPRGMPKLNRTEAPSKNACAVASCAGVQRHRAMRR